MDTRALSRPATKLVSSTHSILAHSPHGRVFFRTHKTFSRTKRSLNIPPHPAFAPSTSQQIIFNPPSAEPSVYHTPFKFLPKTDPRRRANLQSLFTVSSSSSSSKKSSEPTAPILNVPSRNPRYHLTKDDVAEIRRLRAEDPVAWSVGRLAKKFDCSEVFITICTAAPREHKERLERRLEATKDRWGAIRTKAREERTKRKEMMYRGEL